MQHKTFFTIVLTSFFVLLLVGCSNPDGKYVKIEGTITYNGQVVEGASVTFAAVDPNGESGSGLTDAKGKFMLTSSGAANGGTGVLPGEYIVRVSKTKTVSTPDPDEALHQEGKITYEELQKRMATKGPSAGTKIERTELLPVKYSQAHTTDLKATVYKGKNPLFSFDLTD